MAISVFFLSYKDWDPGRYRGLDGELGALGVQALVFPLQLAQDIRMDNIDRHLLQRLSDPAHLQVRLTIMACRDWSF